MGLVPSSPRRARRGLSALAIALSAVVGLGIAAAPVAHADNSLVSSSPADGESLAASPSSLLFTFAEPLGPTNTVLATCNGESFRIGNPSLGADGLSLTVAVPNPMPKGTCRVLVTVSAPDSAPNGQFPITFTITADAPAGTETTVAATDPGTTVEGATTTVATTTPSPTTPDGEADAPKVGGPLGLSRLIATLALAVLLGSFVLIVTAWPEGVEYILTVRFLRATWVLAVVGSVLTAVFLTAQTTGSAVGASISPTAWLDLKDSTPGLAALARVALAIACGWVVIRPERCLDPTTQLPALALPVLAVATFGFSRTGGDLVPIGVLAGAAHAVAMSVWLGGVVLLTRVVLAGPGEDDLVHAVRGFNRIATPALAVTILTGVFQAWRLDWGFLLDTGHGRLVVVKALVVGALVFVGLATRQFVQTRLRTADAMTVPMASRLRRATGIEAAGGVVVLALTSWLLSMAPGGLVASADEVDYGYTQGTVVVDDLDIRVSLTGSVGLNGVRVEVNQPESGLTSLVITFVPPADAQAATVVLTLPSELDGTGVAVLDEAIGIPLDVAGVWTMQVAATTASGPKTAQKTFSLLG